MKPKIYQIISYIFFGLGLIIVLFFRNYKGNIIPYPYLIFGAGLTIYIVGIVLVRRSKKNELKFSIEKLLKERDIIKSNSTRQIKVKLIDTEILDNTYHTESNEQPSLSDWMLMPNYLNYYRAAKNNERQYVTQTVLQYTDIKDGKKYHTPTLNKESKSVEFLINENDTGTIFITKDNNYYFDIEDFLKK